MNKYDKKSIYQTIIKPNNVSTSPTEAFAITETDAFICILFIKIKIKKMKVDRLEAIHRKQTLQNHQKVNKPQIHFGNKLVIIKEFNFYNNLESLVLVCKLFII